MTTVIGTYLLTVLLFLVLPGPVNLAVVDHAARGGWKGALLAVFGSNLASLVLILAAGLMLDGLGRIHESLLDVLAAVGGLYLLYYGSRLWHSRHDLPAAESAPAARGHGAKIVASAFIIGISNPKDVVFFMTFFPPFIVRLGWDLWPGLLLLTALWCLLDYAVLLAYGMGAAKIITPARARTVHTACAALFILIGLYAFGSGIGRFI
ncbi:LysE family translocator [Neisseria leonii]|uniref:LysE family translocator n=1 Tax=Neisseria leonii TaxID=2995413 RepID=UPI00237BA2BB|nr:LysE family translocator [Neisseria sp. 3986]MDD9326277.1 LysE family translocator [Neisseria sp. 3986]